MPNESHLDIVAQGSDALNEWRKNNKNQTLDLQKADFTKHPDIHRSSLVRAQLSPANLTGAVLSGLNLSHAQLDGCNLTSAKLVGTKLHDSNLKGANCSSADLTEIKASRADFRGATLNGVNLDRARCRFCIVDEATLIAPHSGDKTADFTGTPLSSARVSPLAMTRMGHTVRRLSWGAYYRTVRWYIEWPVRAFWWISDYGRSAGRVATCFVIVNLICMFLYMCDVDNSDDSIVSGLKYFEDECGQKTAVADHIVWLRAFYLSVATMTTLGFGDLSASPESFWGHALLVFQVILGYVLLAAIVTRMSVLFQDVD